MKIQTILQAYQNKKKMLPVFIVLLLCFLVLSFITSTMWYGVTISSNHDLDLDYENIYAINIDWKKSIADDSLLLEVKKDDILKELNRSSEISISSFSPNKLLQWKRIESTMLSISSEKHLHLPVGQHFAETFGLSFIMGRGFKKQDFLQPYPAVIIFNSLAQQEKITKLDDQTFVTWEKWDFEKQQFIERTFQVIGIVEDFPFMRRFDDRFNTCIISFSSETEIDRSDNFYLKMKEETPRESVVALFTNILKNNGMEDWVSAVQIRSADEIKSTKMMSFLKDIKIILFVILLLIIYVAFTLFGVFYRHVLNSRSEFAIRRSFGCTRWAIYRKVMFEALLYSLPGVLAGVLLFSNFAILTDISNIVPAILLPTAIILAVVVLSVFIPALYISRQTPVEAFHDE